MSYEIVYNSDVVLSNNSDLTAYCIFYDRVLLPYTSPTADECLEFSRPIGSKSAPVLSAFALSGLIYQDEEGNNRAMEEDVQQWEQENISLFRENVISRLDPPTVEIFSHLETGIELPSAFHSLLRRANAELNSYDSTEERFYFRQDQVTHLLRTDIALPQVFLTASKQPSREILKACEAKQIFTYFLPKTNALRVDQILEVREKVKSTREGFSFHLQKLSKDVESQLKGSESLEEIMRFSRNVIETQLIPDYKEYVRQLSAERAGFWGKVLDSTTKLLQIDAAPWTPKFYGELMKVLGLSILTPISERKQNLSNASQAYQFMYAIEKQLALQRP